MTSSRTWSVWRLHSKEELASSSVQRADGVDAVKEQRFRATYVSLLMQACARLKLPHWVADAAVFYCHRFFLVRSMKKNDRLLVATACLFLATKAEESPRALLDVAQACFHLARAKEVNDPAYAQKLEEFKEHVLVAERAVLYALNFNLKVEHPFNFAMKAIKEMNFALNSPDTPPERKEAGQQIVKICTNFLNDSFKTLLNLQYSPPKLGYSIAFMSVKFVLAKLPKPMPIFVNGLTTEEFFAGVQLSMAEFADIKKQVLAFYTTIGAPSQQQQPATAAGQRPAAAGPAAPTGAPEANTQQQQQPAQLQQPSKAAHESPVELEEGEVGYAPQAASAPLPCSCTAGAATATVDSSKTLEATAVCVSGTTAAALPAAATSPGTPPAEPPVVKTESAAAAVGPATDAAPETTSASQAGHQCAAATEAAAGAAAAKRVLDGAVSSAAAAAACGSRGTARSSKLEDSANEQGHCCSSPDEVNEALSGKAPMHVDGAAAAGQQPPAGAAVRDPAAAAGPGPGQQPSASPVSHGASAELAMSPSRGKKRSFAEAAGGQVMQALLAVEPAAKRSSNDGSRLILA